VTAKILVVEDDTLMQDFLKEALTKLELSVDSASSGEEALEKIQSSHYDLILSDLRMPALSGMEVLKAAKSHLPDSQVVMMTAFGSIESAVEAMKLGAFHYVTKPIKADELEVVVKKALQVNKLQTENKRLRDEVEGRYRFSNIVGKSPLMQRVFDQIQTVAETNSNVLISGETGTGKEIVAKAIHYNSARKEFPFISINCAAIPEGLIESELFGHEKGAFTGAIRTNLGRFELAHGGTILMDEISETSPALQAKLLRVLQEKQFERLGSGTPLQVDVRVVATSNRDLKDLVRQGKFREDLYYRLNVLPIHMPPLRDRKEDITLLIQFFLDRYNQQAGKKVERVEEKALDVLIDYHWPGNVRELENYMERAVVVSKKAVLTLADFPMELVYYSSETADGDAVSLAESEKQLILKTLRECSDNRTRAAGKLGITTRTLRNKLKEYGMK
jgi:DNA-binding NtrC family response regulator